MGRSADGAGKESWPLNGARGWANAGGTIEDTVQAGKSAAAPIKWRAWLRMPKARAGEGTEVRMPEDGALARAPPGRGSQEAAPTEERGVATKRSAWEDSGTALNVDPARKENGAGKYRASKEGEGALLKWGPNSTLPSNRQGISANQS
ncbi:hornerin-like [Iris pallida]|uniref:Hornerin-like n=1 Tax=Iris pallida TaxID=29817 RepID=A0AAX6GW65_IRIPA|nr:hornerin-like [Iris pallida]